MVWMILAGTLKTHSEGFSLTLGLVLLRFAQDPCPLGLAKPCFGSSKPFLFFVIHVIIKPHTDYVRCTITYDLYVRDDGRVATGDSPER